jgi:hypothetical protein
MAQPALLIKKQPKTKMIRWDAFGSPIDAIHKPHKVGHKTNKVPIGLSNRISAK